MSTIVVLNGHNTGDWHPLDRKPMAFGRDEALLASIMDACVSRRHLEVRWDEQDQAFLAVDLGSRNGVLVNGQRVQDSQPLHDDDLIQIGFTLLLFTDLDFSDYRDAEQFVDKATHRHHKHIAELEEEEEKRLNGSLDATHRFHTSA